MQIVGAPSGYVGRGVTAVGCKNGAGEALRALGFRGCWLRSPPQKGPAPVAWYTCEAGCRCSQRVMYVVNVLCMNKPLVSEKKVPRAFGGASARRSGRRRQENTDLIWVDRSYEC